jgi:NAD(P)-dependent dehydrogenase (short-subunit alcohol dehydrogenase family)
VWLVRTLWGADTRFRALIAHAAERFGRLDCLVNNAGDGGTPAGTAELHQPTSAFVWREADASWRIRWFTPSYELPLCGHASLAAAHVLDHDEIVFHHGNGTLSDCWVAG